MNIERRLRKLESSAPDGCWNSIVALTVEEGESKEKVIRRHFGEEGPPEGALIVFDIIVGPPAIPSIQ